MFTYSAVRSINPLPPPTNNDLFLLLLINSILKYKFMDM